MTQGQYHQQAAVLILGLLVSLATGALLGFGHVRAVAVSLAGFSIVLLLVHHVKSRVVSIERVAFWSLGAAFLALPMNAVRISSSITVGDTFLFVAAAFAAFLVLIRRASTPRIPWWLMWGVGAIVVSLVLVEIASDPPAYSAILVQFEGVGFSEPSNLVSGLRLIIAMTLLPTVTAMVARNWSDAHILASAWIVGVSLSSAVVVADFVFGSDFQSQILGLFQADTAGVFPGRATGLAVHPTTLSLTIAMAFPLALCRVRDLRSSLIYIPVVVTMAVAMALSGSRGGFVAVAVAILVGIFFLLPRKQALVSVATIITLGACVLMASQLGIEGLDRFAIDSPATALSDETRLGLYQSSLDLVSASPLVGYGFDSVRVSHNMILQLMIAGGAFALLGYLTVVLGYLVSGIRLSSRVPHGLRPEIAALCLSLIVYLVGGIFYSQIYDRYIFIPAALIFTLVYSGNLESSTIRNVERFSDRKRTG